MSRGEFGYGVAAPQAKPDRNGHVTRYSDSSMFDEVCVRCGTTDGPFGRLDLPCTNPLDTSR